MIDPAAVGGVLIGLLLWFITIFIIRSVKGLCHCHKMNIFGNKINAFIMIVEWLLNFCDALLFTKM